MERTVYITLAEFPESDVAIISVSDSLEKIHQLNLTFFKDIGVDDIQDYYQPKLYEWFPISLNDSDNIWYYIEERKVE